MNVRLLYGSSVRATWSFFPLFICKKKTNLFNTLETGRTGGLVSIHMVYHNTGYRNAWTPDADEKRPGIFRLALCTMYYRKRRDSVIISRQWGAYSLIRRITNTESEGREAEEVVSELLDTIGDGLFGLPRVIRRRQALDRLQKARHFARPLDSDDTRKRKPRRLSGYRQSSQGSPKAYGLRDSLAHLARAALYAGTRSLASFYKELLLCGLAVISRR